MQFDFDCDGEMDSDSLWHLRSDYTVSDHWLGVIEGYSWQVNDGLLVIDTGDGVVWIGELGGNCDMATNGATYVDGEDNGSCWSAEWY